MDWVTEQPEVVAALIAGVAGLVLAIVNFFFGSREKLQERRRSARAELDRYREPLLSAVDELGNRIDNIRNKKFLSYYLKSGRQQSALRSTSFRIAQYFAWTEILFGASGQYRFAADVKTRDVNNKLGWVASTFADDRLDRKDLHRAASSRLMLWREEQRGIGELMRKPDSTPACVGYSTFVKDYDDRYLQWFERFEAELKEIFSPPEPEFKLEPDSERLNLLHGILVELLKELDIEKSVIRFKDKTQEIEKPTWAQKSQYIPPDQYWKVLEKKWEAVLYGDSNALGIATPPEQEQRT